MGAPNSENRAGGCVTVSPVKVIFRRVIPLSASTQYLSSYPLCQIGLDKLKTEKSLFLFGFLPPVSANKSLLSLLSSSIVISISTRSTSHPLIGIMSHGTMIPDHYVDHQSTTDEIALSSIIWGLSLGVSLFTFENACHQTMRAYKRAHKITLYVVYVWLEWASSTIMGIISWMFLKGYIGPSLEYFLAIGERHLYLGRCLDAPSRIRFQT